ncbi:hypothetical protein J7T55_014155 [Diaporthe amygdali]|uniref:uncharacterized protein n=1 Tax=Phomopsis amygdali TaxID=1214568 RepID=UPI0022FEDC67|nr:uncharacterized protein J7T55_014155 [Diaporthe amygdali]KAJ0109593.1 hypothetical protein J7T55_014155 [Diaporthe amygdali]
MPGFDAGKLKSSADCLEVNKGYSPENNPKVRVKTLPWDTTVLGYAQHTSIDTASEPIVANCKAFLVKRDLILPTIDKYSKFYSIPDQTTIVRF